MSDDKATTILKRDVLGRVTVTREQRERLLDEFERSGLKGKPFARLVGVNYPTFASWIQKRRHARGDYARGIGLRPSAPTATMRSVALVEAVAAAPGRSKTAAAAGADMLQLHLPGGAHLWICTPQHATLAAHLLNALRLSC